MALGVLALERGVVPELVTLVAMSPAESRCLGLELCGASCLVARRLRVMGVFLLKPQRLVRGLAIEISENAIRGGGATQLLVCYVPDLVSRGGERLLQRRLPLGPEQPRILWRQEGLSRRCSLRMHVESQFMSHSLELCLRLLVAFGPRRVAGPIAERVVLVGHIVFQSVPSEASGRAIPNVPFAAGVGPVAERRDRPSRV